MPEISIITVCKNAESTISRCINSVASQTVKCQHFLIDGASTDGTLRAVESFPGHFFRVISEPDTGLYAAMNKGLELVQGGIIGILNADDFYVSEDVLESVVAAFSNRGVDACYGDLEYVSARNTSRVVRRWSSGSFDCRKFYVGWMPPHPTLFIRKCIYEKYGLFREDMGTSADYEFMLRLFVKHGLQAHYVPRVLVRMQVGGASNQSLSARWRANRNDALAWKVNQVKPKPWTLIAKPLRKVSQWF